MATPRVYELVANGALPLIHHGMTEVISLVAVEALQPLLPSDED